MFKNKQIIRFLTKIICFLGFSMVTYFLLLIIWGTFLPIFINKNLQFKFRTEGHTYTRLKEADTVKNVDILFIGSSHVFRGYDPRVFEKNNLKIFDLSSVAQTPVISKLLFEKYIHTMNPKLIILDIYPTILDMDRAEAKADYLSSTEFSMTNLKLAVQSKNILVINTFLYSTFFHSSGIFDSYKEPKKRLYDKYNLKGNYDEYIGGGFVETSYKNGNYVPEKFKSVKLGFHHSNIEELKKLITLIKEHNIKFILIQTPVTKNLFNSITNNRDIDKQFSSYGPYYNFNTILDIPTQYFYDSNHFTQEGVKLFDQEFINYMKKDSTFVSALPLH
ncbi:hypothetical protein [Apibacter adventoris]|uniref:SGNH/GDSL hydrolase family protein n=1 Tax=Apibacter adventoris TaxID=1679466 RepID=A0A2S8AEF8_9FLAO|nr:hypothetical protein [Apibacter adventoris]PQL93423.1 hypothetical protein C4S77_04560 [Apibacter adventoris]